MNNIIFIEGLPGSGKTTYSKKITKALKDKGFEVAGFEEGDLHPIDLAWCSITREKDFNTLITKYSKYKDQIMKHTSFNQAVYITAYTKVRVDDMDIDFYNDFSKYEIYQENDFNIFKDTHLKLWSSFINIAKPNTTYVFECIFLQNHINELILKFNLEKDDIIKYFIELINCLKDFKISLIYLRQKNIDFTLNKTIEARRYKHPYKDWVDLVIDYLENSNYGNKLGYTGLKGFFKYFNHRQDLELQVIEKLAIDNEIFIIDDNYDEVYDSIKKYVIKRVQ